MQLKTFDKNEKQKNNKTTILVVVVFLFVIAIVLGKSFALYQKEENKDVISSVVEVCTVKSGTTWDFDYVKDAEDKGYEQEFVIPCTGNYRLETWGAQGASISASSSINVIGGYGGYSEGVTNLKAKEKIYIKVGEAGKYCAGTREAPCYVGASFNGGGSCGSLTGYG